MGLNPHMMVICEGLTKHRYESSHPDIKQSESVSGSEHSHSVFSLSHSLSYSEEDEIIDHGNFQ